MNDMKYLFHTSMARITITNTCMCGGYILGALIGFTYHYLNRQLVFIVMTLSAGIGITLHPYCQHMWQLYLCAFCTSVGGGVWDSGNQVWSIEMWGSR
ncbi:unnamed protein product, partial [Medioppia subpectinata]